ncbi:LysR family transcriptional regulator [Trinickia caryophylli]|uniref:Transcriptional regulator, LysR family n=1 Tax=Trinickia caryophylli TaxID=28094 RepID=A0A1X7HA13_TRICW|nr:LysR family transcriptional regulator [Trinickia caryophylli]PMS08960.1 LysR family transcriptional regulator [Trinickia caryophylli]TRX17512.1 LysR family transcriptional regulator [Trinickia caryophylli]WQE11740.1 LysR family transcriptional regulator [Trinickia caryophylli]SMF82431.1 transcriptional regulator, LysR family [Trinickia caryophylli]GLU35824.1 LysR family transcriptional regulator [Trinickia caryophylli]
MSTRKLRDIDLNLLVVFKDIMETRNISATARRLNMSQPAASNALARLRATLDDPLLVRSGHTMQPTRLAALIAQDIDHGMALLQAALDRRETFDPAVDSRRFVIAVTDVGEVYFLPKLLAYCSQHAPHVHIEASYASGAALRDGLQEGRIDLALGPHDDLAGGLLHARLFKQHCVSVFRAGHPFASQPPTSLAAFREARHVLVANPASPYVDIEQRLEKAGIRIASHDQVSSFLTALFIVANSDRVATVPYKLAEQFCEPMGLRFVRPPLRLPELETHCFWHRRSEADVGLSWLRGVIVERFAERAGAGNAKTRPS